MYLHYDPSQYYYYYFLPFFYTSLLTTVNYYFIYRVRFDTLHFFFPTASHRFFLTLQFFLFLFLFPLPPLLYPLLLLPSVRKKKKMVWSHIMRQWQNSRAFRIQFFSFFFNFFVVTFFFLHYFTLLFILKLLPCRLPFM